MNAFPSLVKIAPSCRRLAAGIVTTALLHSSTSTFAATITVTPGNMDGWAFHATDGAGTVGLGTGTGQLVNGPATPPLGTGSANFNLTSGSNGDESVQLRNSDWAGTRLDAITELSYSTYATVNNGSQLPFLNLYINYTGGTTRDDRLWFEPVYSSATAGNGNPNPAQGPVALNTWQFWNALTGMWYSDSTTPNANQFPADLNGPGDHAITFAQFIAAHPNAVLINDPGQGGLGGIRIASGFSSPGDRYNTFVDAFTIGTDAGATTYDFELAEVRSRRLSRCSASVSSASRRAVGDARLTRVGN